MNPNLHKLETAFLRAVRSPAGERRDAVLDEECQGDTELHRLVLKMLSKHEATELAVDTPVFRADAPTTPDRTSSADDTIPLGTVIAGRYRIIDRLGQGGMGTVYRAEQSAPLARTVAIKLMKPGLDSKSLLLRFESERQALARMNHPNIAKVHDAGAVPLRLAGESELTSLCDSEFIGRPFFVMEYVDGVTITQFCQQEKLTTRQRIELMVPICQAIEHAHQKGVIHRDLKPGNILVTQRDGRAVPVIIDFGIAKCLETRIGENSQQTGWGMFLGTLEYMAPEQVAGHSSEIDTRADVYSLGAVLYELLTGAVPVDREKLRGASIIEMIALLQEHEPALPSVRTNSMELRGELDWIVMKCLEKDPQRRYPSARMLSDDLARYLANEPVTAGPPSKIYRLRKFVRRHTYSVIAASIVLLSMVGGIAGTTWAMVQARRAEATALAALEEKERQRVRADASAAAAKFVSDFLQFDVIEQANPKRQFQAGFEPDSNLTIRTALDRAAAKIEPRFGDKPAAEAVIRRAVGNAYYGVGEYALAVKHLQRARELAEKLWSADYEPALVIYRDLARSLQNAKRVEESVPLFERVLESRRKTSGLDDAKTLAAETDLANAFRDLDRNEDAEQLLTHVYNTSRVSSPNSVGTIHTLLNLAGLDERRGRFDEAVRKLESLKELVGPEQDLDPTAKLMATLGLGRFCLEASKPIEGIRYLESARDTALKMYSFDHPDSLNAVSLLADAYAANGRSADAMDLVEDTRSKLLTILPTSDNRVRRFSLELARIAMDSGDLKKAALLVQEIQPSYLPSKSGDRVANAVAMSIRGRCFYLEGNFTEAEQHARRALDILAKRQPDDYQTHEARALLGLTLVAQRRFAEAEPELTKSYAGLQKFGYLLFHTTRRRFPEIADALVQCAVALDRTADAEKWKAERRRLETASR